MSMFYLTNWWEVCILLYLPFQHFPPKSFSKMCFPGWWVHVYLGLHTCHTAIEEVLALGILELISGLGDTAEWWFYITRLGAFSRTFTEWPLELCYCSTWKNTVRNRPPKSSLQVSGYDCMMQLKTPQNKKNEGREKIPNKSLPLQTLNQTAFQSHLVPHSGLWTAKESWQHV